MKGNNFLQPPLIIIFNTIVARNQVEISSNLFVVYPNTNLLCLKFDERDYEAQYLLDFKG